jgi:hypothetical protein
VTYGIFVKLAEGAWAALGYGMLQAAIVQNDIAHGQQRSLLVDCVPCKKQVKWFCYGGADNRPTCRVCDIDLAQSETLAITSDPSATAVTHDELLKEAIF